MNIWKKFLGLFKGERKEVVVGEKCCESDCKHSLHIGINNYPGSANDLRGCVNDANNWEKLLRDQYGFKATSLVDNKATYRNVVKAIKKIVTSAKAGDNVVITFSGHGTNVRNLDGTESDRRDECICLYDKLLVDNAIAVIFNQLPQGAKLTFISDSCHSGTITRSFLNTLYDEDAPKPRYLPPEDLEEILDITPRSVKSKVEDINHVLITGCLDHQFSYDAKIGGIFQGAMSANAIDILKKNPDCTYEEFSNLLRAKLPSRRYPQNPQVTIGSKYSKTKVFS